VEHICLEVVEQLGTSMHLRYDCKIINLYVVSKDIGLVNGPTLMRVLYDREHVPIVEKTSVAAFEYITELRKEYVRWACRE